MVAAGRTRDCRTERQRQAGIGEGIDCGISRGGLRRLKGRDAPGLHAWQVPCRGTADLQRRRGIRYGALWRDDAEAHRSCGRWEERRLQREPMSPTGCQRSLHVLDQACRMRRLSRADDGPCSMRRRSAARDYWRDSIRGPESQRCVSAYRCPSSSPRAAAEEAAPRTPPS